MRLLADVVVADRYRLVHRLGVGGMADVWLAEDTELDRKVALKVLHERFAQDRQFVERFRREASSVAGLQHPNVVGVFDRGEVDGAHYIAMEYVEGSSLKDLIGSLGVPEAIEIARQILAAARFAHEHGIVHRDLKPHNVIVDPAGRVRVLDFGIARAGASEITQTGSVMGTAQYLSPEQAQGLEVTPASDLYAVGVVLYEMLTGRVPFEGDSAVAVALKQVSEQPLAPSALNPAVTPALDTVILRALAKDPVNRFRSAEEFSHALDLAEADPSGGALGGTATYAAAAPPPEPVVEPVDTERGRRLRWIALAGLGAALIAVLLIALTRPGTAPVPSVLGDDFQRAVAVLEDSGFEVAINQVTNQAPRDTVLEQSPRAGERAQQGSTVTLTVSSGPGRGQIPDVSGLPEDEATEELEDAGFRVTSEEEDSDIVDAGNVVRTEPPGGERARVGSVVTVFVSTGPELTAVPDVVGESEPIARSRLERAGFIVDVERTESSAERGTVTSQDPAGGTEVEEGEEVTIVVSEGPGDVTVPNVVGQRRDSAVERLRGLDLEPRVIEVETEVRREDDRILEQFPSAGSEVPPGTDVTIEVGVFDEPADDDEGGASGGDTASAAPPP